MPYIAQNDRYQLIVDYDDDPEDPYQEDTLGTIAHWHRRMHLGGSKGILLPGNYDSGQKDFETSIAN